MPPKREYIFIASLTKLIVEHGFLGPVEDAQSESG